MYTKAYYASSVPAAVEVARQELGENAMLVGSKPTPPHVRQYGRLEVTFAWDPKEAPERRAEAAPARPAAPVPPPGADTWGGELKGANQSLSDIDAIRRELSSIRAAVGLGTAVSGVSDSDPERIASPTGSVRAADPPPSDGVSDKLVLAGFSRALADEIAGSVASRSAGPRDYGRDEIPVVEEIACRIPVASFSEMKPGETRALAFIGPPGRGKSTSLVKIAVSYGLARQIPVRIYTVGAHCIGGREQMARFATILGTPWQSFESMASLNLALNGENWKGLALIDTPGISPADREEMDELTGFFAGRPAIEKHLVLRADSSSPDLIQSVQRFAPLSPSRILFTGVDETASLGPAVGALIRSRIPAVFSGTGQRIPEDLDEVQAESLARAVWSAANIVAPPDSIQRAGAKFAQAAA